MPFLDHFWWRTADRHSTVRHRPLTALLVGAILLRVWIPASDPGTAAAGRLHEAGARGVLWRARRHTSRVFRRRVSKVYIRQIVRLQAVCHGAGVDGAGPAENGSRGPGLRLARRKLAAGPVLGSGEARGTMRQGRSVRSWVDVWAGRGEGEAGRIEDVRIRAGLVNKNDHPASTWCLILHPTVMRGNWLEFRPCNVTLPGVHSR
jgi:hypothetical protein